MSENEIPEEEIWRFTDDEMSTILKALEIYWKRCWESSQNVITIRDNQDSMMLPKIDSLINRIEFRDEDENDADYLTNYNNADEIEPYGVNPLDYEK